MLPYNQMGMQQQGLQRTGQQQQQYQFQQPQQQQQQQQQPTYVVQQPNGAFVQMVGGSGQTMHYQVPQQPATTSATGLQLGQQQQQQPQLQSGYQQQGSVGQPQGYPAGGTNQASGNAGYVHVMIGNQLYAVPQSQASQLMGAQQQQFQPQQGSVQQPQQQQQAGNQQSQQKQQQQGIQAQYNQQWQWQQPQQQQQQQQPQPQQQLFLMQTGDGGPGQLMQLVDLGNGMKGVMPYTGGQQQQVQPQFVQQQQQPQQQQQQPGSSLPAYQTTQMGGMQASQTNQQDAHQKLQPFGVQGSRHPARQPIHATAAIGGATPNTQQSPGQTAITMANINANMGALHLPQQQQQVQQQQHQMTAGMAQGNVISQTQASLVGILSAPGATATTPGSESSPAHQSTAGSGGLAKRCQHCQKDFISNAVLQMHIAQNHPEADQKVVPVSSANKLENTAPLFSFGGGSGPLLNLGAPAFNSASPSADMQGGSGHTATVVVGSGEYQQPQMQYINDPSGGKKQQASDLPAPFLLSATFDDAVLRFLGGQPGGAAKLRTVYEYMATTFATLTAEAAVKHDGNFARAVNGVAGVDVSDPHDIDAAVAKLQPSFNILAQNRVKIGPA